MVANATYVLTGSIDITGSSDSLGLAISGPSGVAGSCTVATSGITAGTASVNERIPIDGSTIATVEYLIGPSTVLSGIVRTGGTAGNLQIKIKSVGGASVTAKTDSFIMLQRVA